MLLNYDAVIQAIRQNFPSEEPSQEATDAALAEITFIITSALHAEPWAAGQQTLKEFKDCGVEDDNTRALCIVGTVPAIFALATVKMLELLARHGAELGMANTDVINRAPACFAPEKREQLPSFIWELVRGLAFISQEDYEAMELLHRSEICPDDEELQKCLEDIPEEMRTSKLYFKYVLTSKLAPVLSSMAAWCKVHEGVGLGDVVFSRLQNIAN